MFAFRDDLGRVEVAFTDRHGGVSGAPYAGLNLARVGPDQPAGEAATLLQDLRRVIVAFAPDLDPARVVGMHQVHGNDVAVVDERYLAARPSTPVDALVTRLADVALLVRAADCVPLLLADPDTGVVAVAHAGRPGLVADVVGATVATMRALGALDIVAWVGPHICGSCYEVPEQLRSQVAAAVPGTGAQTSWGTPSVDIGAGVRTQLAQAGAEVVEIGRCTLEDDDLYSYRRQGLAAGRLGGLIRRRA